MIGDAGVCRAARPKAQCDVLDGLKSITTILRLWMT